MSDQRGKVLSFGPFELSIGNRLLTNGAKTALPEEEQIAGFSLRGDETQGLRA